ncbi:hypothetical protein MMC10_001233 [Thelotrema lepadinum]|nr:hypothetical protein [Thelotrema lepadinum]
MYSRITVTATTLLGALVSKSLAQSCEYSDEYSCDPYGSDPYGTPTYTGHGNALTEYPDLESLLAVIAPQVTSISPDQASIIEEDLSDYEYSYTYDNPLPTILSKDPLEYLENDPSQTIDSSLIYRIEDLMEYPTDSAAMSDLASILSGNSASSYIMAYETAAADYQSSMYAGVAPIIYADLGMSGSGSLPSQTAPSSASAFPTTSSLSFSSLSTLSTSVSGSSSTKSSTRLILGTGTATTGTSASASSTSAPNSVSSALAAPTAGPQLVFNAVAAAAGLIGMAIL